MRWMPYSAPSLRTALPSYYSLTSTCCWTPLSPPHFSPCFSPSTSPWLNPHPPTRLVTNWTWASLGTAPPQHCDPGPGMDLCMPGRHLRMDIDPPPEAEPGEDRAALPPSEGLPND
ncbi:hypothetical protein AAFF_G00086810 [Aldrovandia affinis]|uniref:Uncharacterized protein n=1 Tax=Aldrovandia affinis TaxID=143900 RepID=A0AAD7RZA7_9TELE|nr:hypothetical protein AAFF_G00086810 [Aldrovandia affinis]